MKQNKFIIVVCCYNAAPYIERCLDSIKQQEYENYEVLIVDDKSTDKTWEIIDENMCSNYTAIRNDSNMGAVHNKTIAIWKTLKPNDNDIIIGLDGDDNFTDGMVLKRLNEAYQDESLWTTYGECTYPETVPHYGCSIDWDKPIRRQEFRYPNPRTYKWFLLKNIPYTEMCYRNEVLFKTPEDWVLSFPVLEMAGSLHTRYIKDELTEYHMTPLYDFKVNPEKSNEVRVILLNRLGLQTRTESELKGNEVDWK